MAAPVAAVSPMGLPPPRSQLPPASDDKRLEVFATVIPFWGLALVVLMLRLYTRIFVIQSFGLDDLAALFAFVAQGASGILTIIETQFGLRRHIFYVRPESIRTFLILLYASEIAYVTGTYLIKLSLLLQYLRFFTGKALVRTTYVLIGVFSAWYVATVISTIFQCTPIQRVWAPTTPGHCINLRAAIVAGASINIVFDVIVLILPMKVVWSLQMPKARKLALAGVFAIGSIATIISILRLVSIFNIRNQIDVTFEDVDAIVLSNLEVYIAIVCACLPVLRRYFSRIIPSLGTNADPSQYTNKAYKSSTTYPTKAPSSSTFSLKRSNTQRSGPIGRSPLYESKAQMKARIGFDEISWPVERPEIREMEVPKNLDNSVRGVAQQQRQTSRESLPSNRRPDNSVGGVARQLRQMSRESLPSTPRPSRTPSNPRLARTPSKPRSNRIESADEGSDSGISWPVGRNFF